MENPPCVDTKFGMHLWTFIYLGAGVAGQSVAETDVR